MIPSGAGNPMLQYSMHQDPKRAMGPFNGPVPTQQVPYINAQQFQQFPAPLPPPPQHVAHALQVQAVPVQAPARHVLDPTLPDSELAPFVPNTSVFVSHTPKPFQCVVPACDKKYRQLTGIINHHYERHRAAQPDDDPERLFRCEVPLCGQLYKQAGGLAYHIERSHAGLKKLTSAASRVPPEQKPYGCNENDCGKRFKSPNGLAYHKEKGHGKAGVEKRAGMFACNECGASFDEFGKLAFHHNQDHVQARVAAMVQRTQQTAAAARPTQSSAQQLPSLLQQSQQQQQPNHRPSLQGVPQPGYPAQYN